MNPDGQNQAAAQIRFLQSSHVGKLIVEKELYFGDPTIVGTPVGRRYLRSAYCFFIDKYVAGKCYG